MPDLKYQLRKVEQELRPNSENYKIPTLKDQLGEESEAHGLDLQLHLDRIRESLETAQTYLEDFQ